MSQIRKKKDKTITSLKEWVQRWPNDRDLGFNRETREPCIYEKGTNKEIATIPWRREGDTLVVLSQPDKYSQKLVDAARKRYGEYCEKEHGLQEATNQQMRILEDSVLNAWRNYRTASGTVQDVLDAEKALRMMEEAQQNKDKDIITYAAYVGPYTPMNAKVRALPLE